MAIRGVRTRPYVPPDERYSWLIGRPVWRQAALDGLAGLFAAATFLQLGEPDVLLHAAWVVLAFEAFEFGLRITSIRIVAATGVVVTYAWLAQSHVISSAWAHLELSEWPLMVVIILVVAVMADRVTSTGRHYARLYRVANDRLLTAQEDERKRLARDLHDGVGQTITALTLTLDAAEAGLWGTRDRPTGLTRSAIERCQELAAIALRETRDVANRLRPVRMHETGLVAAIRELAANAGVPVMVNASADLVPVGLLPVDTELNAYRIVQEALANAARHSHAQHISIDLARPGGQLVIEVRDDGLGFDPSSAAFRGLGLAGMRERAMMSGALLDVLSVAHRGTTVRLTIRPDPMCVGTGEDAFPRTAEQRANPTPARSGS